MTMIRRELPRSRSASSRPESSIAQKSRGFSFRRRPIRSLGQRGPEKAGELAGDGGDDVLFRFAARGEPAIAAMQPVLRVPGVVDDGGWRAALAVSEGIARETGDAGSARRIRRARGGDGHCRFW